jgi:antitoxin PrlF
MPTATMTSKGQITLPAETRARLRLVAGSKFSVRETPDGEIVLKPKKGDIRKLRGILKYDGPPVSIEEMNESIGRAIVESFKRSVE